MQKTTATIDLDELNGVRFAHLSELAVEPDGEAWWEGELEIEGWVSWDRATATTPPGGDVGIERVALDSLPIDTYWLDVLELREIAEEAMVAAWGEAEEQRAWDRREVC